jgi:ribosomal protein S18 acetylase RimI-like enzyme
MQGLTEPQVQTRALEGRDLEDVGRLLDAALGRGAWELDPGSPGSHRVAVTEGRVIGAVSACVTASVAGVEALPAPVGTLRLIAVDPAFRGRGVAMRLTGEACRECEQRGAATLLAYAWIHAATGAAPGAHVLQRLGFVRRGRIDGFFGALALAEPCPGCGSAPCLCAVDVYVRRAAATGESTAELQ